MRKALETATVGSQFEFTREAIFELAESMREAADNMPEQLNRTHSESADKLDFSLSELYCCDVPDALSDLEVTWSVWRGKIHRPQRRDNAVGFLKAYLASVHDCEDNKELRAHLQTAIDVLEIVFFPGMSGRRAA